MSDTPRTDEQINGKPCTRFDILAGDSLRNAAVPSEFARTLERELNVANERIKRLEETLDKTTKIASQRIKRLEDRIRRASIAFFEDGSDASVASGMLAILEEERGKP